MATYHLTVHQLFERLSQDESKSSSTAILSHNHADPTPGDKTTRGANGRSDSVISWLSNTNSLNEEAEEIDFTDYGFERIVEEEKKNGGRR